MELGEARKLVLEQWGGFEGKREEIVEEIEGFYRELTEKMNEAINDVVDHMTLQDLVDYEMKECSDYVI